MVPPGSSRLLMALPTPIALAIPSAVHGLTATRCTNYCRWGWRQNNGPQRRQQESGVEGLRACYWLNWYRPVLGLMSSHSSAHNPRDEGDATEHGDGWDRGHRLYNTIELGVGTASATTSLSLSNNLVCNYMPSSKFGYASFHYRAIDLWNNLPIDIKQCQTLYMFKTKLKNYFINIQKNTHNII